MAEEVLKRKLTAILSVDFGRNRCPDITSQLQERVIKWMPQKFPIWNLRGLNFSSGVSKCFLLKMETKIILRVTWFFKIIGQAIRRS